MSKQQVSKHHPSAQSSNELWEMAIGLNLPDGIEYYRQKDVGYLEAAPEIPYPDQSALDMKYKLGFLLTPEPDVEDVTATRRYALPSNTSTLAAILNEAAGTTDSFEVEPNQSRTVAMLRELFSSIVDQLRALKDQENLVPESLNYSQLLIEKNSRAGHVDFKVLPPFTLLKLEKREIRTAWLRAGRLLIKSMADGCDTDAQRGLANTLKEEIGTAFLSKS
ncbi:MAG: hypothetical protein WBO35_06715 [Candidatus Saccharimonadales bacterium]